MFYCFQMLPKYDLLLSDNINMTILERWELKIKVHVTSEILDTKVSYAWFPNINETTIGRFESILSDTQARPPTLVVTGKTSSTLFVLLLSLSGVCVFQASCCITC